MEDEEQEFNGKFGYMPKKTQNEDREDDKQDEPPKK